ncbi:MAG: Rab family GTPase [Candidatus Hodarchaeota archaeon]
MGKFTYKVVLLGNPSVGKTSLILRFVKDQFRDTAPTLGVNFLLKTVQLEYQGQQHSAELVVWDIGGQTVFEDAPTLKRNYCQEARTVILVYEISSRTSFENLDAWVQMIQDYVPSLSVICLVGNKSDLEEQREISLEQGEEKAKTINADIFFETSAKTGTQVSEMFEMLALNLVQATLEKHKVG